MRKGGKGGKKGGREGREGRREEGREEGREGGREGGSEAGREGGKGERERGREERKGEREPTFETQTSLPRWQRWHCSSPGGMLADVGWQTMGRRPGPASRGNVSMLVLTS